MLAHLIRRVIFFNYFGFYVAVSRDTAKIYTLLKMLKTRRRYNENITYRTPTTTFVFYNYVAGALVKKKNKKIS